MNTETLFIKIQKIIIEDCVEPLHSRSGFYDLFIMYPGEPKHPDNKYGLEIHTEIAGEIRRLFSWLDEILGSNCKYTLLQCQDVFEVYMTNDQVFELLHDSHTRFLTKNERLVLLLDNFVTLVRNDINTIQAQTRRRIA